MSAAAEAVVVGAGQSGLFAGRMLAEQGIATTVVERLPAAGGQEPEGEVEHALTHAAGRAGVAWLLGTMAVRFDGGALETLGVEGSRRLNANVLVLATGSRPASRGELNIAGDRCAGVLPATAAIHLLDSGVLPGHRPLVYGGGALATECARKLVAAGARSVTVVSPGAAVAVPAGVESIGGWRVTRVAGVSRVAAAWVERGGARERLAVDALLIAEGRIPMRNVEGAVGQGEHPDVISCHSAADPKRADDAEMTARVAVAAAVRRLGIARNPNEGSE